MTLTERETLREKATRATPGPWTTKYDDDLDEWRVALDDEWLSESSDTPIATCHQVTEDGDGEPDAAYIATADPQTIITLLDQLTAHEQEVATLRAERDEWKRKAEAWTAPE